MPDISGGVVVTGLTRTGLPVGRVAAFLAAYVTLAWLVIGDKYVQTPREAFLWAVVALLVLLDVADWRDFSALRRRLLVTLGLTTGTLLFSELLRKGIDRPEISRREALAALRSFSADALWAATAWLYAPLLLQNRRLALSWGTSAGALFWTATTLVLLTAWSLATALASVRPDISFRYFGREIGVAAPLVLAWLRWSSADERLRPALRWWGSVVLLAGTLLGFLVGATYALGPASVQARLETPVVEFSDIVLRQPTAEGSVWRLSFPFGHHNRMAFFSAVAVVGLLAAGLTRTRRTGLVAVLCWAGAAAAAANLAMTLNRGAAVALGAGLAAAGLLSLGWRRGRWFLLALPVLVVGAVIALPQRQENRFRSLLDREAYTRSDSTIAIRFHHWEAALWMLRENPLAGIGYGWRNFEDYYQNTVAGRLGYPRGHEAVHAHNLWLQTAAETGWPGALLWLAFSVLRWILLVQVWRRRAHLTAGQRQLLLAWTAMEITIQVYSLGNLSLRRSLGLLTWGTWMLMTSDLLAWRHQASNASSADLASHLRH